MKTLFALLSLILAIAGSVRGQEALRHLYLGNDTHTDLMWNGDEEKWYQYSLDMADFYLHLGEQTRERDPAFSSKWNYDVGWTLYMMEQRTSPEYFGRIVAQIKNGQASVPYNFTLAVYGASTAESVIRSLYYGGHLERTFGIDMDLAISQENATLPLGLASLWAGSGARYSWKGVCNCATKVNTVGRRDHEIYWYTGLDGARILMKWYSNAGWNAELGGYSEMLEPTLAVMQMDTLCGSEAYPYQMAGAFGKGWDNIHNYSHDLLWGLPRRTLPGTKVYLSNQSDFFHAFENRYGHELPEVSLSHGNEWDLNLASLSEVSGQLRRSMEKLRSAEMMAAVTMPGNSPDLDGLEEMKSGFLYALGVHNLHSWTADGPISRHDFATYMRTQQLRVSTYVDSLHALASLAMGRRINPGKRQHAVFVFNPLNWKRSALVDIPSAPAYAAVKDPETGRIFRGIRVEKQDGEYLRVWLDDLPPAGYRVYTLLQEQAAEKDLPFSFSGDSLETPFYTAVIKPGGSISYLWDKKHRRNWVENGMNMAGSGIREAAGEVRILEQGSHHITFLCASETPFSHESRITFYAEDPRIDVENTILQNFNDPLHWSFGVRVHDPEVWHEEVGAVIKAKLASAGGHYADRMARYDYLSLNHFVRVGNERGGISISNADCLFFKLGESRSDFLDMQSSTIHVLAGGQVNKSENLGIIDQDGDSVFHQHFSLLPAEGKFDQAASMRFSLEHQNPVVAGRAVPGGDWNKSSLTFVRSDHPDALLWTMKHGEEEGLVLRYWNMGSAPLSIECTFPVSLQKASQCTHVETDIAEIPVRGKTLSLELNPQEMKSIRVALD